MVFTVDKSFLAGLFLESIFFGVFLISFGGCIRALTWRDGEFIPSNQIRWPMLGLALFFAGFAIMDPILLLKHNIIGFVEYQGPGGAIQEFSDRSNFYNVMSTVDLTIPETICHVVLIWRCWIVYDRSYWAIVAPALVWAATSAVVGYMIFMQATIKIGQTQESVITSFAILTVVQNILTSGLIIWRIRLVDRENLKYGNARLLRPTLQRVIRMVIESGLLNTTFTIVSFCTYITNSNAFYSVTDAEIEIVGTAFNLIIIRASSVRIDEYSRPNHSSMSISTVLNFKTGTGTTNTGTPLSHRSHRSDSGMNELASKQAQDVFIDV